MGRFLSRSAIEGLLRPEAGRRGEGAQRRSEVPSPQASERHVGDDEDRHAIRSPHPCRCLTMTRRPPADRPSARTRSCAASARAPVRRSPGWCSPPGGCRRRRRGPGPRRLPHHLRVRCRCGVGVHGAGVAVEGEASGDLTACSTLQRPDVQARPLDLTYDCQRWPLPWTRKIL